MLYSVFSFCWTTAGISCKCPCTPSLMSLPPSPVLPLQVTMERQAVLRMVVCLCQCYSLNSFYLPLPLLCPQVCSLHLCLCSWSGTQERGQNQRHTHSHVIRLPISKLRTAGKSLFAITAQIHSLQISICWLLGDWQYEGTSNSNKKYKEITRF